MKRKEIGLLLLILLIGGAVRVFHLETMFLNGDEPIHQVRISYQPLAFVLRYNNGPLFSILVHFLLPLGPLEIMLRLIPFLSGMAAVALTFFLGRVLFSRPIGAIAALLAACNHLLIYYSQNGRTYALTTALFLAAVLFLVQAVRSGRRGLWAAFGVALGLCLYTHTVAFLILPPIALYAAVVWWKTPRKGGAPEPRLGRAAFARRFLISTGAAAIGAILLYLPCAWMVDMFKGSIVRGVDRAQAASRLSLRGIFDILHLEISPTSRTVFLATLAFILIGVLASRRRRRRSLLLVGASAAFPWLVFLLGNPRENDIASLYRYLQHLLPLLFMLAAQGILLIASGAAAIFRRSTAARRTVRTVAAAVLAAALAGGGLANLRGYQFTDFWRQGSYRFDPEVRKTLEARADRDALLYIDAYPVATQLVMMNPLSKDQSFWDNELAAREEFVRALPSAPLMIMAIDWIYFRDFIASRKIELWAVTPAGPEKAGSLRAASAGGGGFEVVELPRFTLLHFRKDERSLAEKMADLADLLVSWTDGDAVLRRQRLIFAAQSYLLTRPAAEAAGAIRAFRAIPVSDSEDSANAGTAAERTLGGLLGYGPKALREFLEARAFAEIDGLLLVYSRNMIDSGSPADAWEALELFANGKGPDRSRAIEPLIALGDLFEKSGQNSRALQAWETAARLSPGREDIASRIARVRRKSPG